MIAVDSKLKISRRYLSLACVCNHFRSLNGKMHLDLFLFFKKKGFIQDLRIEELTIYPIKGKINRLGGRGG